MNTLNPIEQAVALGARIAEVRRLLDASHTALSVPGGAATLAPLVCCLQEQEARFVAELDALINLYAPDVIGV